MKNKTLPFIVLITALLFIIPTLPASQDHTSNDNDTQLVIITYPFFEKNLEALKTHKETYGISTQIITTRDIYKGTYFPPQGTDRQEQIKYFIKNAKENWNTTDILIVGNYWRVPIRIIHLESDTGGAYEETQYASDLYYADLYNEDYSFARWDSNNNQIYGEWPWPEDAEQIDHMDLTPDINVGRLACINNNEVRTVVDKIITYETQTSGSDWFNNFVLVGGDTFEPEYENGTDYSEGEIACEHAKDLMGSFTPLTCYASHNTITAEHIKTALNTGAGFAYFMGHGSPRTFATHYNDPPYNWTEDFDQQQITSLSNNYKLPVLMIGGCHNSHITTTPLNLIKGLLTKGPFYFITLGEGFPDYYKYDWLRETWSWVFVKHDNGGAIATIGSIGYGWVDTGDENHDGIPDVIQGSDGWFETHFFDLYHNYNITTLGDLYSKTLTDYINMFPPNEDRYDAKVLSTHLLLGDPTLKIGGYPQ